MKVQIIIYTLFTFLVISECGSILDFIGSVQNEIHNIKEGIEKIVVNGVQILHKKRQIVQEEFNEFIKDTHKILIKEGRNYHPYYRYERSNSYANSETAKTNLDNAIQNNVNTPESLSLYSASILNNANKNNVHMRNGDWQQDEPHGTFQVSEGRGITPLPNKMYFPDNIKQFNNQGYRGYTNCPIGMIEAADGSCREPGTYFTRESKNPNPIGIFEAGCPIGYIRDGTGRCKPFKLFK